MVKMEPTGVCGESEDGGVHPWLQSAAMVVMTMAMAGSCSGGDEGDGLDAAVGVAAGCMWRWRPAGVVAVAMVMARAEVVGDKVEWWECMMWVAASSRQPAGVAT